MTKIAALIGGFLFVLGLLAAAVASGSHSGSDFWLHCTNIPVVCQEETPPVSTVTVIQTQPTTTQPTTTTTEPPSETCDKTASPGDSAQALVDSLAPGETACLRGGTYNSVRFNSGNKLLRSFPGEQARIAGPVYITDAANNVTISDIDIEGQGGSITVQVYGDSFVLEDSDVTNKHRGTSCILLGSPGGGLAANAVIQRNVIHECGRSGSSLDHGIYAALSTGALITRNVFWSSAGYAIQLYPNSDGSTVSLNTIDGGLPSIRGGIILGGESATADNNLIEKNVIAFARTYNVDVWWGGPTGSGNVVRRNCLWQGVNGNLSPGGGYSASDNLIADPLFVDRTVRDYRLRPGPCLTLVSG